MRIVIEIYSCFSRHHETKNSKILDFLITNSITVKNHLKVKPQKYSNLFCCKEDMSIMKLS